MVILCVRFHTTEHTMPNDHVSAIQNWGRQTIVLALGLRDDPEWNALSEEEQARRVNREYDPIGKSLWEAAQKECGTNLTMIPRVYSKHVLRWVQQQFPLG